MALAMNSIFFPKIFQKAINWVSRSKISVTGSIIVAILLPVLSISFTFDYFGFIQNPYFGFLLYVFMAPLFVLGLILIFVGTVLRPGREDLGIYTFEYFKEQLSRPGRYTRVRRLIYFTIGITLFCCFLVGMVSYGTFRYTASNSFCGQFCHQVMAPQYTAYKNSPHSKVACVECHFGKDATWAERSKFTGIKQLFAVTTNSYSRPILSPIKALRPGRKTCEECHRPEKFKGLMLYIKDGFLPDKNNTRVQTIMIMKVGSGDVAGSPAHGIHWHVSENQQVFYRAADRGRDIITEVRVVEKGKKDVVFERIQGLDSQGFPQTGLVDGSLLRKMDCVDCHNRPTHIFLQPDEALDRKIAEDSIPRYLPFIKTQALKAITGDFPSVKVARVQISRQLQEWYRKNYPDLIQKNPGLLERAIQGTIEAYEENVFPEMKVTWGTYKNFLGHSDGSGCFRCHGKLRERKTKKVISSDCNLCHVVLAKDQVRPDILKILKGVLL